MDGGTNSLGTLPEPLHQSGQIGYGPLLDTADFLA
jgi:hypothetical protein